MGQQPALDHRHVLSMQRSEKLHEKGGSSRAEFDKLCERDPLLLCGFQNDILKGVFSTDLISAVKYFCVGETVWMSSQTLTHSLIKPPIAGGVQSDLLSVMLGRNERMTTICVRFFPLLFLISRRAFISPSTEPDKA